MIAHKSHRPMHPVVVGGSAAGNQVLPMRSQQHQHPPQMVGHHNHNQQQQHLLQEPANYYANTASNERFIHVEQNSHQGSQAARFVPSRPQQYQPQQVLQQQDHQNQHHHHHAQTQVPPHQLPYQASAPTTSGYNVAEQQLPRFQGDQTSHPYNNNIVSQQPVATDPNYRAGANQVPIVRAQQQQQQQQITRPPVYTNNQQQIPVRQPMGVQTNRPLARQTQQQQNYQVYKANMAQSQVIAPATNNQHHLQSTTASGYQNQQIASVSQHQMQSQHHPNPPPSFMGNGTVIDEYASNSPNLLQQQLNRKQQPQQRPGPVHQQPPPQTRPIPAISQVPVQRPQGVNYKSNNRIRPTMQVVGPQSQPQIVSRFCGDTAESSNHVEHYTMAQADQMNQGQRVQPIYYQQQQQQAVISGHSQQHQQPQRPQIIRQPNQLPQQQRQIPPQMPLDTSGHLIGNPTPPLTPNAPHMRQQAANMTGSDEWSQNQHHHGHIDHMQHPQPAIQTGYADGPSGSSSVHIDGLSKQSIPYHNHNHQQPQQTRLLNNGLSASSAPTQQAQRVLSNSTTMPKTTNAAGPDNNSAHYQVASGMHHQPQQHNHNHHQHGIQASITSQNVPLVQQGPRPSGPSVVSDHHQQVAPTQPSLLTNNELSVGPHHKSPIGMQQPNQHAPITRLTLPLRDVALIRPFRLEHDAQFTTKVFHINQQLFDTLGKSMSLVNPQATTVIQELQFRAYLIDNPTVNKSSNSGESLLASNNQLVNSSGKSCQWPELLQISVNQHIVHLDRSKQSHKAVDIFRFCHLGDNVLDIQVKGCYCTHEFVLEAVERPTLKAFMNSCFKSRLLHQDACLQKLKYNFGSPGYLIQNPNLQSMGIVNEYITEYNQGGEQTRAKISLRCPISGRRMRTPTRGHDCKHLQCFDLENFLSLNSDRTQWNCPVCSLAIPFNMLELDQHQMNINQNMMSDMNSNTIEDVLIDCNGQWQAFFASSMQQQQQHPRTPQNVITQHPTSQNQYNQQPQITNTARSNGTFHPQPSFVESPIQGQSSRPVTGTSLIAPAGSPINSTGYRVQPSNWDGQYQASQQSPADSNTNAAGLSTPPTCNPNTAIRRPPSASQSGVVPTTGRRSATGSPLAKRPYAGRYASPQPQPSPLSQSPSTSIVTNTTVHHNQQQSLIATSASCENAEDISPLEAMERTIIQHEQQMGPPPFDPNSLASSNPLRASSANHMTTAPSQLSTTGPIPPQSQVGSPATSSLHHQQQQHSSHSSLSIQPSPEAVVRSSSVCGSNFSPNPHAISSPVSGRAISASHQQQMPPQSPMQHQPSSNISISTPATPSSAHLVHGGPETPATPSNSIQNQQHHRQQPHYNSTNSVTRASNNSQPTVTGVDHQPLSNGSASAGSITSSSTMTPSGQSLGSVGMGGDSRCNTVPLQNNPSLDDLVLASGSDGMGCSTQSIGGNGYNHQSSLDDKNEILMSKLMESSESILHRNSDLAIALEEEEWKQQLDRGKSEHLANFLNEPLMNKKHHEHSLENHHHMMSSLSNNEENGSGKMLSGGLNPSDDEGNHSHGSSPGGANIDQLDQFPGYLDADTADDGAGLPPDDSILDLFER